MPKEETFYEILGVSRNASVSEIVSAYHTAKNTFSKDSMATYSLMSPEESEAMLAKLEQAYITLSNLDKRRAYDRRLDKPDEVDDSPSVITETPAAEQTASGGDPRLPLDGTALRTYREHNNLSLEDVCRITKIPQRYLSAIESQDFAKLPARVYLQGFVKNLATLYKLDPKKTSEAYLEWVNQQSKK